MIAWASIISCDLFNLFKFYLVLFTSVCLNLNKLTSYQNLITCLQVTILSASVLPPTRIVKAAVCNCGNSLVRLLTENTSSLEAII